jgi:flagellar M-ring protein FliF
MDPQQIMSRVTALLSSFHPAQLASLVGAFVLVVGIVAGSAWWVNSPTYVLLFSDMEPEAAGEIVTRLKTMKVSYQLDEGGRAIRVPVDRVDELRLELTSQGMPASGRVGFELFDRTSFGATQFLEQVNYRRALEGEIARTIGTLSEVANARVHIAPGKDTLFGDPQPAKASVVLKLRGQRSLPASTVAGLTNLVAASVEGLSPDAVVILDSYGRPLARPVVEDESGSAGQVERQQRLEKELGARVVALLEPMVGPERVRVNVALRLNPATVQQTEERFDPATVLRSRQVESDSSTNAGAPAGLAGARANQPPPAPDPRNQAPAAQAQAQGQPQAPPAQAPPAQAQALQPVTIGGSGTSRSLETLNYEVGRTTVVTQRPPGDIARISVAVIVDDEQVAQKGEDGTTSVTRKPRTPEALQKIQGLVAAAVGFEPDRGDQITVQNVSFEEPSVEEAPALTTLQQVQRYGPQIWEGIRMLAVVLVGALAMWFFVRPLMKQVGSLAPVRSGTAAAPAGGAPGQPVRTVADLESEIEAQLDASSTPKVDSRRLPVLARRVTAMSAKEPENVAKLLRSWINEGER